MTRLVSPGFDLAEILGRKAWVYIGLADSELEFPDDYPILFSGVIDDVTMDSKITITVSHPDQKKRQDIFRHVEASLAQNLTSGATTIYLDSVDDFLDDYGTEFRTYVKINDEIIQYTGINTGTVALTGCVRAQFGTIAAAAAVDDTASSFYRLTGGAIDLALKVMLSGENVYFVEDLAVASFDASSSTFLISGVDLVKKYGIIVGDLATTTGSAEAGNNNSLAEITALSVDASGTTVTVTGVTFVDEDPSAALVAFKSQYNVLPDGLGMGGDEVDVEEFLRISAVFGAQFHNYDFYLTEEVNGKEFIDSEILYPSNLYSIPRKGRVSLGAVGPPIASSTIPILDADTIVEPQKTKIRRNLNKYLYNTVVVRYDFDAIETDVPLAGYIRKDEDSTARFGRLRKTYAITAKGLRRSSSTDTILDINARRILDRYSRGAEFIQVEVAYRVGFTIDVGDVVLFGDPTLPFSDTVLGQRGFSPRLCEVIDRKLDIKSGRCSLTIVDTSYLLSARYGVISPASVIGSGATTSVIPIDSSYGYTKQEWEKWKEYEGLNLKIHSTNWATNVDTKLVSANSDNTLTVTTLASPPTAGMIVDVPPYPSSVLSTTNFLYKNKFVFLNPKLDVATGISQTQFTVSASHFAKLRVGATIMVHTENYATVSPEVVVTALSGVTVTVDTALGFTPTSAYDVDLVGFLDGGAAYRYF